MEFNREEVAKFGGQNWKKIIVHNHIRKSLKLYGEIQVIFIFMGSNFNIKGSILRHGYAKQRLKQLYNIFKIETAVVAVSPNTYFIYTMSR